MKKNSYFVFFATVIFSCFGLYADPIVSAGAAEYAEWAPEMRELHVRIPMIANPDGGNDIFVPQEILVDGLRPSYALWYFNGTTFDYEPMVNVSKQKIEVFVPIFWKPSEEHVINLAYNYCGKNGMISVKAVTPSEGGAWQNALGPGNIGFCVKEEYGLGRTNEIVEFDVVIEKKFFPNPEKTVRATIVESKKHLAIPCQVYEVEDIDDTLVRFCAAVPISISAGGKVLVFLWNCNSEGKTPPSGLLKMSSSTNAVLVGNDFYSIRLSPQSGQMMTWNDLKRNLLFDYQDPRKMEESLHVINRTPDVYRTGKAWSHALDWVQGQYEQKNIVGSVFIETMRWGKMPFLDEFSCNVRYRFMTGRPEVFITSVLSADKEAVILGLRNGGISLTPTLFTHAAWPLQNGDVKIIPLESALGNDTGAPPSARMPTDTPWIALFHTDKKYGFSVHTIRQAYFNKGQYHPITARRQSYVSVYRHYTVYTIRSMTQTYLANIHSLPVKIHAGTELYEEMMFAPFDLLQGTGKEMFRQVEDMHKRFIYPLVIIP